MHIKNKKSLTSKNNNLDKKLTANNKPNPNNSKNKMKRSRGQKKQKKQQNNKSKNQNLNILYTNVNGIKTKEKSLGEIITGEDIHIALIAETKFNDIPKRIKNYTWSTKNRLKNGGGVGILTRNDITPKVRTIELFNEDGIEILWLKILTKVKPTIIGIFYGAQEGKKTNAETFSKITTQINEYKQKHRVILAGDFNAKLEINNGTIKQSESKNGKLLNELLKNTGMIPVSLTKGNIYWTRENRQNSNEKSIIDYVLVDKDSINNITNMQIDAHGLIRPFYIHEDKNGQKIKTETDHNTITFTINTHMKIESDPIKVWKKGTESNWLNYDKKIQTINTHSEIQTAESLTKAMTTSLNKTVGQKTLNTQHNENKLIKQARQNKREAKKEFETLIKEKTENTNNPNTENQINNEHKIKNALDKYKEMQVALRTILENEEKESLKKTYTRILEQGQGGKRCNIIWKIRKQINKSNKTIEYDIITEDGTVITDPEQSKEYIASYYEQLYQAREAEEGYQEITEEIEEQVKKWSIQEDHNIDQTPITVKELNNAIKKLQKGKSVGPDDIPNEAIINTSPETRKIILNVFNKIIQNQNPPEKWQEGLITRLYKGKGQKGKCSNERGITVSSNLGKLFERIINERCKAVTNISDAQSQAKRATTDHLLVLKEIISYQKQKKKPAHLVFLDVTKAYDKAWLTGIMYAMHNNGLVGPLWNTVKKMNENLTAKLKTKDGITRPIHIKDSIRQGGVLSVMQYGVLMDEIAKAIKQKNLGCKIPGKEEKMGCLLWVDDVVLISENPKELQEMLDITHKIASKYHIVFGKEKSKVMNIGTRKVPKFKLGEMELEPTSEYKYLGEVIDNKLSLKKHIEHITHKAEGTYQTILALAGDTLFKGMEMETIWQLTETIIIPNIVYGCETWRYNQTEGDDINRILDNILKRLLMVPKSTPREALYIETGILDITHIIDKRKLGMYNRLDKTKNKLIQNILESNANKTWQKDIFKIAEHYNITENQLKETKHKTKEIIKQTINKRFKTDLNENGQDKHKIQHLITNKPNWQAQNRPKYMNMLNRHQISMIFKARTRMVDVKNNYRGKYPDNICRGCGSHPETQTHIFEECPKFHQNNTTKITNTQIFSDDIETLKQTSSNIDLILRRIGQSEGPQVSASGNTQGSGPASGCSLDQ